MPPVSGGMPGNGSVRSTSMVSRRACSGSPPSGRPTGRVPVQYASPPVAVSAADDRTPMNDQRDHECPFSADSKRNVPGRSAASLR